MQEEEAPPKQWRSTASSNWREPESSSRPSPPPMRSFQRNNDNRGQSGAAPGTRLYVGNLLYTAQTADVQQFFTENGYNDAKVTMTTDPFTGRNPSYCFVDLSSPEEASKALEQLNGAEVLGRAVRMGPGNSKREGGVQARVKTYERGTGRSESGPCMFPCLRDAFRVLEAMAILMSMQHTTTPNRVSTAGPGTMHPATSPHQRKKASVSTSAVCHL